MKKKEIKKAALHEINILKGIVRCDKYEEKYKTLKEYRDFLLIELNQSYKIIDEL